VTTVARLAQVTPAAWTTAAGPAPTLISAVQQLNIRIPAEGTPAGLYTRVFGPGFVDPNSATFTPDDEQIMIGVNHRQLVEASKETIHVWPTKIGTMASALCGYVGRNMTKDEWANFVGADLRINRSVARWV
jgi:hypothetical protein